MSAGIIDLGDAAPLASGTARRSYLHPQDPSRLLKVQFKTVPGKRHWYDRSPRITPSNDRELAGYQDVIAKIGADHPFLSKVYGKVATTLGEALMVENVIHDAVSWHRFKPIANGRDTRISAADLRAVVDEYRRIVELFHRAGVYNHCLNWESVMIVRRDGALQIKLIDYKSLVYRQFISPRWVPGARRYIQGARINRRIAVLEQRIAAMSAASDKAPQATDN